MAKKFKHFKSHKAAINQAIAQGLQTKTVPEQQTAANAVSAQQQLAERTAVSVHTRDTYRSLAVISVIIVLFAALSYYDRANHVLLPIANDIFEQFVR